MSAIKAILRPVPGFAELDGDVLERVAANGEIAEVHSGDVLFRQGSLPESLYVLLEGQVSLTGTTADASSTVIDILGPCSSFVLASVLADEPYLTNAEAISPARLVRIAAGPMRDVVAERPNTAMAMIRAMSAE
ncbi:MAG TPA: cyclic nucleotide-binding domain-containing protein, partial [Acetobacteraceae bacterium]|nr:cyclic nucleotide-binding domain-containing protein [Acetobacteraceae bacterium]